MFELQVKKNKRITLEKLIEFLTEKNKYLEKKNIFRTRHRILDYRQRFIQNTINIKQKKRHNIQNNKNIRICNNNTFKKHK